MKKLIVIFMMICNVVSLYAAPERKKLDLEVTNDFRRTQFYFNASDTQKFEFDGQPFTGKMDIDLREKKNGSYGTFTFHDDTRDVTYTYAITERFHHGFPLSKGITLKGINGTKGTLNCNIDFDRDNTQGYSLLFFEVPSFMGDRQTLSLNFTEPDLRVPERVKTAEELKREEELRAQREEKRRIEREKKDLEENISSAIGFLTIIYALFMARRAMRRQKLLPLLLLTFMGLASSNAPFLFLPSLPVYFWWYYQLYKDNYSNDELESKFWTFLFISWVVLSFLFYSIFGWKAIVYSIIWFFANLAAMEFVYLEVMFRGRCSHCHYYGPNQIVDKQFFREQIQRIITKSHTLDDRVETEDTITEWYSTHYNVKVKAHQTYKYFRYCPHCGKIFYTYHYRTKTLSDRDY